MQCTHCDFKCSHGMYRSEWMLERGAEEKKTAFFIFLLLGEMIMFTLSSCF